MLGDEAPAGQLVDEMAIHLLVELEVEGVERLTGIAKARLLAAALEQPIGTTRELVAHELRQDRTRTALAGSEFRDAVKAIGNAQVFSGLAHFAAAIRANARFCSRPCLTVTTLSQQVAMPTLIGRHKGDVLSAQFSPDGTLVVTASTDGTAQVWDARTGAPLSAPLQNEDLVRSALAVPAPDGVGILVVHATEKRCSQLSAHPTVLP